MNNHATEDEKKIIRRMTKRDKTQKEIAAALGWTASSSRNRVYYWQNKLGLTLHRPGPRGPELNEEQKAEALSLLNQNLGVRKVFRRLGLREWAIRQLAAEHHISSSTRFKDLAPEVQEKILEQIRQHADHAKHIAAKNNAPYRAVVRVAHIELDCPCFVGGLSNPPLRSNFPQKNHRRGGLST